MRSSPAQLLRRAYRDARTVRALRPRLSFIASGYDTTFTSLERQVYRKLAQLEATYRDLEWRLIVVDDLPVHFELEAAAHRAGERFGSPNRVAILPYGGARFEDGREKGAALLQAMRYACAAEAPDALCYLNLNLKVHAAFSATGMRRVLGDGHAAAIGTRSPEEGGWPRGAGSLGRTKSRIFNALVASLLPEIGRYRDTNAPLKVFSPEAARLLSDRARVRHITMDCEWLVLLHQEGLHPVRFPIVWTQARGSQPPWHRVPASAFDILRLRINASN
ncbi:MAG: hypothetical protein AAF654_07275 [Myxococcota bacterium]